MTEQTELIAILKDAINHKKSDVKEYNDRLDQNLSKKIEIPLSCSLSLLPTSIEASRILFF